MAPTYEERFIPRIVTKGLDCEGAASCTALTCEGAASCTTLTTEQLTCEGAASCTTLTTAAGSLTAPAIVCPTDADTGLYWNGKDLQFGVDGSRRAFWSANGLNAIRYGDNARMIGFRANGTDASPTATVDGNSLFSFFAYGHNGTEFRTAGQLRFTQDGAVGVGVPAKVSIFGSTNTSTAVEGLVVRASGTTEIKLALAHQGSTLGFFNTTPTTKPTITGSRGGNAALASLLTKLAGLGLLTDSTTA